MLVFVFMLLASFAVWEGTQQRLGSLDEWRALAGSLSALLISGGVSVLTS